MNFANQKRRGFTVVELLVSIVIIGILAAIVTVSYHSYQDDTNVAAMKRDLAAINLALEKYYAKNGAYPISASSGVGWNRRAASGENFIPGLIPDYIRTVPDVNHGDKSNTGDNTYIYRSDGREYKLLRLAELNKNFEDYEVAAIEPALQDANTARWNATVKRGWGYWTPGAGKNY